MNESLHYLLMTNHLLFQKLLLMLIKDTGLTVGQPKVLDYLRYHDGAVQKDIANACHIEPATITTVLLGMEKNQLIIRKNKDGNRRSLYVYLTDKGRTMSEQVEKCFDIIEEKAYKNFTDDEKETFISLLTRVKDNINLKEIDYNE